MGHCRDKEVPISFQIYMKMLKEERKGKIKSIVNVLNLNVPSNLIHRLQNFIIKEWKIEIQICLLTGHKKNNQIIIIILLIMIYLTQILDNHFSSQKFVVVLEISKDPIQKIQ